MKKGWKERRKEERMKKGREGGRRIEAFRVK